MHKEKENKGDCVEIQKQTNNAKQTQIVNQNKSKTSISMEYFETKVPAGGVILLLDLV